MKETYLLFAVKLPKLYIQTDRLDSFGGISDHVISAFSLNK